MRVLHILNELRFSGAEVLLYTAAPHFLQYGQCSILSTGHQVGEFAKELVSIGYTVEHIPFERNVSFFRSLSSMVRGSSYDVVHIHTERASFWIGLTARGSGASCLRTIHSEFMFEGRLRIIRGVQRRVLRSLGVGQIACSYRVRRNELDRFGNETQVIENWFDPSRVAIADPQTRGLARKRLGIDDETFVVVSVGNHSPAKNHESIVEAVKRLSRDLEILYLYVGKCATEFADRAKAELGHRIRLCGSVSTISEYLVAGDVFVNASHYEGGPIALLEAAASGIPCVTTRVGMSESLGGYDLVFYCGSSPEEIADAVRSVTAVERDIVVSRGRAIAEEMRERYDPRRGAEQYLNAYRKLLVK